MTSKSPAFAAVFCAAALLTAAPRLPAQEIIAGHTDTPLIPGTSWHVHDPARPQPPVVTAPDTPGHPPSDAVVLFDGRDLSAWRGLDGQSARWTVKDGELIPAAGGDIRTEREFGDAQVHLEFATPVPPQGTGQDRGNSGVFLQGQYEVQVLDSHGNQTYPDGQAGAVYGQHPPQVNASRAAGEWQTYDIVFTAPRLAPDGTLKAPAYVTVLHNGVLVQNHAAILGPSVHSALAKYGKVIPATGPLRLQFHGNPVRYRNIWVRPLRAEP